MEIVWYGHSCFRITERGKASVVCDPYDYEVIGYSQLRLKAEITTVRHISRGILHQMRERKPIPITGPGEYEKWRSVYHGIRTTRQIRRTATEMAVLKQY
jgi:L-ascorbate metabolism protein UlaG (beta-lactamase superfamily)